MSTELTQFVRPLENNSFKGFVSHHSDAELDIAALSQLVHEVLMHLTPLKPEIPSEKIDDDDMFFDAEEDQFFDCVEQQENDVDNHHTTDHKVSSKGHNDKESYTAKTTSDIAKDSKLLANPSCGSGGDDEGSINSSDDYLCEIKVSEFAAAFTEEVSMLFQHCLDPKLGVNWGRQVVDIIAGQLPALCAAASVIVPSFSAGMSAFAWGSAIYLDIIMACVWMICGSVSNYMLTLETCKALFDAVFDRLFESKDRKYLIDDNKKYQALFCVMMAMSIVCGVGPSLSVWAINTSLWGQFTSIAGGTLTYGFGIYKVGSKLCKRVAHAKASSWLGGLFCSQSIDEIHKENALKKIRYQLLNRVDEVRNKLAQKVVMSEDLALLSDALGSEDPQEIIEAIFALVNDNDVKIKGMLKPLAFALTAIEVTGIITADAGYGFDTYIKIVQKGWGHMAGSFFGLACFLPLSMLGCSGTYNVYKTLTSLPLNKKSLALFGLFIFGMGTTGATGYSACDRAGSCLEHGPYYRTCESTWYSKAYGYFGATFAGASNSVYSLLLGERIKNTSKDIYHKKNQDKLRQRHLSSALQQLMELISDMPTKKIKALVVELESDYRTGLFADAMLSADESRALNESLSCFKRQDTYDFGVI